ncbi:MAG TPA: hypothetical protein PLP99_08675 [Ignavibacteriales bacterium]|nr:hypothetical protein [Ignavibacteriales bacterium]
MPRVFQIFDYEINPASEQAFLNAISKLKKSYEKIKGLELFSITKSKTNKNQYQEIYIFADVDAYENYDEYLDDNDNDIISEIQEYIVENSTRYYNYFEVK